MPAPDPLFSVMRTISESKLIPNRHLLQHYDSEDLAELAFMHILTVRILLAEPDLKPFPQTYCRKTIRYGNFKSWHIDSTDLYVMLYGLIADDAKPTATPHKLQVYMPIDPLLVSRWLRAGADRHADPALTHRLFVKLDSMFRVKNSSLRAIRRLVMDWDEITTRQRRLALTRLLQLMRQRAPRGELLRWLNRVAVLRNLEIDDVDNPETGEEKPSTIHHARFATLRTLAQESATAGATAASNIAGLGGGFDTDYTKSIYPAPAKARAKKRLPLTRRAAAG